MELKKESLSAALVLTGTTVRVVHPQECPEIGPICKVRDEPPQQHDQTFWVAELRAILDYAVNDHFGLQLQVPFKVTATQVRFLREDGTPFEPDYVNIHHRNETLAGIGDPQVMVNGGGELGRVSLRAHGGVTVPIGRTTPDPFALGDEGLPHQHIQFGTGTVDPVFAVEVGVPIGDYRVAMLGRAQLSVRENGFGYQAGNRFSASLLGEGPVVRDLRASVGVDLVNEQPERWSGRVQQDGNLGRTDLLVGAGLSYPLGGFTLSLNVRVPVWQQIIVHDVHEAGQLSFPAIIGLGVQRTFDLGN